MVNKLEVGQTIHTSQFPWQNDAFIIRAIQNVKPNRFLFCENLKTGKFVNLVECFCEVPKKKRPFVELKNVQIIRLLKAGAKGEVTKEYVRRFKHVPKFVKR